jgi:DUF4097 and DUF4098 domain-containing protein YvlB
MAGYPPPYPPPAPPPGFDPRDQRRFERDQQRAQREAYRAHRDYMHYQMRGLRRGSILGPLLLIAIGIVFLLLQTGRLDGHRFWEWYGHRWPLLLVIAGILLLAEWTFDQFHLRDPQHPQYRRSIGGGIFLLLLVFGIIGVIAAHGISFYPTQSNFIFNPFHIGSDGLNEFLGDKHESDQTLDYALPSGASFAVVNPRGDVTISGTSDDNRIHLAIHKQVYATTDSDADSKAKQLTPSVANSGSAVILSMPSLEGARSDLILTVPAAMTTVNADRGDIHVAFIKAAVTVTANHGDIELSAITGPATARINNRTSSISAHNMGAAISIAGRAQDVTLADITGPVSITGDFFGTTHLERINGSVHFHSSRTDLQLARLDGQFELGGSDLSVDQALGPVVLTTNHNNVTLNRIAGDIAVTNRNGSIDLTAAPSSISQLGNITLEDRVGSIKVILPEHAGFSVQADTTNGDIDTDLPLSTAAPAWELSRGNNQRRDNHRTMNGTVGAGGPLVHITTTNGDISIHKGTVAPIPATPPALPKLTLVPPVAPAAPGAHRPAKPAQPTPPATTPN